MLCNIFRSQSLRLNNDWVGHIFWYETYRLLNPKLHGSTILTLQFNGESMNSRLTYKWIKYIKEIVTQTNFQRKLIPIKSLWGLWGYIYSSGMVMYAYPRITNFRFTNFSDNEPCEFIAIFQFTNIIFTTTKNQLMSYHWFFMISIRTVIKVLMKIIVYSLFTQAPMYIL
jgi:hypothetical protein